MSRKTQKKLRKLLTLVSCAVLLVCVTIGATVAYLTSQDQVVNTFTVGNVAITLDEADVNPDGTYVNGVNQRVDKNEYHLLPGHSYIKDPTIYVDNDSEDCYIYVKIVNQIPDIEKGDAADTNNGEYLSIAKQMENKGWKQLVVDGVSVSGVFYATKTVAGNETTAVFSKNDTVKVFDGFTLDNDAVVARYAPVVDKDGKIISQSKIEITAYAIQKDGFNTPEDAWAAANLLG